MAAPVFTDGVTPLNQTVFNLLGAEVNKKVDLPGGAVTNGQWLKGVGGAVVWSSIGVGDLPTGIPPANIGGGYAPNKITVGTMAAGPPASPATNDIWIATDVDANGTCWHFRYNAAEATMKWEYIGGASLMVAAASVVNTTTTGSWVDLGGPQLTAPRTGDYEVFLCADAYHSAVAHTNIGLSLGGAAPGVFGGTPLANTNQNTTVSFKWLMNLTSGSVIKMMYSNDTAGTANWRARVIDMKPVRIS